MTDHSETAWEQDEIESHLRSAMDALTPNVFDKIDLSTPQEIYVKPSRRVRMYRRMRTVAMAAAACLCVAVLGGGVSFYQNHRVDSVIGIDVNPSIELSVNRNEKVLQANPLNEDAETILDDMNLKNVDLDIAVNALIGSMVRKGYLDELDNAILVGWCRHHLLCQYGRDVYPPATGTTSSSSTDQLLPHRFRRHHYFRFAFATSHLQQYTHHCNGRQRSAAGAGLSVD